jgi:short-subunit dehydrogenase
MRFAGTCALVTGASSGIGRALAVELARQGADVALLARRDDLLRGVAAEVEAAGRRAVVLTCDVTDRAEVDRAVSEAVRRLGSLDVVVANAGFGVAGDVEALTVEDFRRQFETNVFGVLHTVYATLPALRKSKGRLALMGSVSGHVSAPGVAPYSMSKFAVRALAEALRIEQEAAGVSVTLVSPGFVESEIRLLDNRGRRDPDAKDLVPRWLVMPSSTAAKKILRAIHRRRREIVVTLHGKLAVFLQRFAPWTLRVAARRVRWRSRGPSRD